MIFTESGTKLKAKDKYISFITSALCKYKHCGQGRGLAVRFLGKSDNTSKELNEVCIPVPQSFKQASLRVQSFVKRWFYWVGSGYDHKLCHSSVLKKRLAKANAERLAIASRSTPTS